MTEASFRLLRVMEASFRLLREIGNYGIEIICLYHHGSGVQIIENFNEIEQRCFVLAVYTYDLKL